MNGVTCALNKLVEEHLGSTGYSKSDLARALGFQNVGKGVRRIDQFLETGVPNEFLVEHLGEALGLEPEDYQALLEQHREELQAALNAEREAEVERRRQAFRPFVFPAHRAEDTHPDHHRRDDFHPSLALSPHPGRGPGR